MPSLLFGKEDADGRGDVDDRATLVGQFAGLGVDPVGGHGVRIGPSGEQPTSIVGQVDISGKGSADRLNLNDLEFPVLGVGPVDRYAVVSPVGRIDEAPVRVNENLGRGVKSLAFLVLFTDGGLGGERWHTIGADLSMTHGRGATSYATDSPLEPLNSARILD